jgi:hypothetical protein
LSRPAGWHAAGGTNADPTHGERRTAVEDPGDSESVRMANRNRGVDGSISSTASMIDIVPRGIADRYVR